MRSSETDARVPADCACRARPWRRPRCSQATRCARADAAATVQAKHPISGLDVIPLTISQNGKAHTLPRRSGPRRRSSRQKGLMFRTAMGPDEGMLFP